MSCVNLSQQKDSLVNTSPSCLLVSPYCLCIPGVKIDPVKKPVQVHTVNPGDMTHCQASPLVIMTASSSSNMKRDARLLVLHVFVRCITQTVYDRVDLMFSFVVAFLFALSASIARYRGFEGVPPTICCPRAHIVFPTRTIYLRAQSTEPWITCCVTQCRGVLFVANYKHFNTI